MWRERLAGLQQTPVTDVAPTFRVMRWRCREALECSFRLSRRWFKFVQRGRFADTRQEENRKIFQKFFGDGRRSFLRSARRRWRSNTGRRAGTARACMLRTEGGF
jgi:hypothetical protein